MEKPVDYVEKMRSDLHSVRPASVSARPQASPSFNSTTTARAGRQPAPSLKTHPRTTRQAADPRTRAAGTKSRFHAGQLSGNPSLRVAV